MGYTVLEPSARTVDAVRLDDAFGSEQPTSAVIPSKNNGHARKKLDIVYALRFGEVTVNISFTDHQG
jgi:hypothetical protein